MGNPPPRWPPGFRFSPTDEELVLFFLKRRIASGRPTPYIADTDVYRSHPSLLPERSALRTGDKQWFFCSRMDRKYPNGSRASRTTGDGYWKTTGKDRSVCGGGGRPVGSKKTLVYYHGRAPRGQRTDWVMHEYTISRDALPPAARGGESYALYKLFQKSGAGPKNGEQYGAPFREEDWLDDDDAVEGIPAAADPIVSTTTSGGAAISEEHVEDLEELLLHIGDDQESVQPQLDLSTPVSSQVHIQQGHRQDWLGVDGDKGEVADVSTSGSGVLVPENQCTELPIGDLEGLLMQISDDQQTAELLSDFPTSVPQPQLHHDVHQAWLNANMEEICVEDYTTSSGAVVAKECTGTELPYGDLEGLLLQIQNDQQNFEPLSDFSTPVTRPDGHQVVGDFHGSHSGTFSYVDLSSVVKANSEFHTRNVPSNQNTESVLTNVLLSREANCTEETSVLRSVSGLVSYDSQDVDEFLEINDFFDPKDLGQSMGCHATEHLISSSNGMFDSLEYFDAPMFLPGSFDTAEVVAENQYVGFGDNRTQNHGFQYTNELWTNSQVALNVQSHSKHNHVIFSSPGSGTASIHNVNEEQPNPNRSSSASQSWFNATLSALLDSVPSSPAMAAENTVLNRTLQRISSFRSQPVSNEKSSTPVIQVRRRGLGLISISLLVLLAAILWTFTTGSAVKFCKGIWKFSAT